MQQKTRSEWVASFVFVEPMCGFGAVCLSEPASQTLLVAVRLADPGDFLRRLFQILAGVG